MVKNTVDLLKNGVLVTSHNGENYNMCVFLQNVKLFDNIWRLLEDLIITLSRARPTKLELWWYINHFKIFPTRPRTYLPPAVGPGTKFQITKLVIEWKPSYINLKDRIFASISRRFPSQGSSRDCLICWNFSGYRCLFLSLTSWFENTGRDVEAAALAGHHHVGLVRSVEFLVRTEV